MKVNPRLEIIASKSRCLNRGEWKGDKKRFWKTYYPGKCYFGMASAHFFNTTRSLDTFKKSHHLRVTIATNRNHTIIRVYRSNASISWHPYTMLLLAEEADRSEVASIFLSMQKKD